MDNINATTIAVIIGVIVLVLGLGYFLIGTDEDIFGELDVGTAYG